MQGRKLVRTAGLMATAALGSCSAVALAQASAPAATTWDIFGGAAYARLASATTSAAASSNRNAIGFIASVSQRPYEKYPWIGGTIEGSGVYASGNYVLQGTTYTEAQHLYTFMGGPMVMLPRGRVQPFARVLFGDTFGYSANSSEVTPVSTTTRNFGIAFGGGADLNFGPSWALRGQADWIDGHMSSTQSARTLRASIGAAYKF
jgi:hypothetical protein